MLGRIVLREASCRDCEVKINAFEQPLMKGFFLPIRMWSQMWGRKKKDANRPVPLFSVGEKKEKLDLPISEHPTHIFLPSYPRPSLLWKRELVQAPQHRLWGRILNPSQVTKFTSSASHSLDLLALYRLLAKIAHSFAVGELGLDGFVPVLRAYILGGQFSGTVPWFLGGANSQPAENRTLHEVCLIKLARVGGDVLLVRIRLFGYLGAPVFYVIVGYRDRSVPSSE